MWQPIDTAPKDGTVLLLYDAGDDIPGKPVIMVGYYNKLRQEQKFYRSAWMPVYIDHIQLSPSHWMPLPDPPDMPTTGN